MAICPSRKRKLTHHVNLPLERWPQASVNGKALQVVLTPWDGVPTGSDVSMCSHLLDRWPTAIWPLFPSILWTLLTHQPPLVDKSSGQYSLLMSLSV